MTTPRGDANGPRGIPASAGGLPPGDSDRPDRDVQVVVVGAIASGWFLFALVGPLALFLTWFGDCFRATCPVASDLDRAIYTADLLAWIALPALIVFAYRGSRAACAAAAVIGAGIVAQAAASVVGARGFQTFFLVFPAGGLIVIGGLLGALGRELAGRPRRPTGRLAGPAGRPPHRPSVRRRGRT